MGGPRATCDARVVQKRVQRRTFDTSIAQARVARVVQFVATIWAMANPATDLADTLQQWAAMPPSTSVYQFRAGSADDIEFWRRQTKVADLVEQVDAILKALAETGRSIAHYERWLPSWYRGVFGPEKHWGESSSNSTSFVDQSAIDVLRGLADVIDSVAPQIRLSVQEQTSVLDGLDEILDLLEDLGLSAPEQRYIFELVSSLKTALGEKDTFGAIDLARRINELYGALSVVSDMMDDTEASGKMRDRIKAALAKIVPYARQTGTVGFLVLGAAADIQQITGH